MKNCRLKFNSGMTFIELIVVIGIFATITSVVLFNFTGFTTNISLQNLASQIALQLKKAQTEALSGQNSSLFAPPDKPSFGIYFSTATAARQKQFDFFADYYPQNAQDDSVSFCAPGPANECLNQISIQTGDKIKNLYAGGYVQTLNVTFKRPFPEARFVADGLAADPSVSRVGIGILSPKGAEKTIVVWKTGQISILGDCINRAFSISATCQ